MTRWRDRPAVSHATREGRAPMVRRLPGGLQGVDRVGGVIGCNGGPWGVASCLAAGVHSSTSTSWGHAARLVLEGPGRGARPGP